MGGFDFIFWENENIIEYKRWKRRKSACSKNLRKQVGEKIYCPCCHKRMRKKFPEHIICGKTRCNEKMKPYIELINRKK